MDGSLPDAVTERHDRYSSPLAERYASDSMLELWSARTRYGLWRRLWLALAESQQELGVDIPAEALKQMREHLDDIDFDAVAAYERRFKHDVMAHIHAFADVAPAARPFIHLGSTSAYVTDNADLIIIRRALELLRAKVVVTIRALTAFARQWRDEPTLGYTHLQPAQLTTVGKRATVWIQDFALDVAELEHRIATLPLHGVKGTTGTQASFLEIFEGDHEKVRELERRMTARMDFGRALAVTGQTYTRKLDSHALSAVTGIAASAAKFSSDIRMLQSFGELEEPFEDEQVGSSAMAYKRNPMRSERIAGLARFVITLESNAAHTHSVQFLERTLDDSANRRLVLPEAFLSADAILVLASHIASGLRVNVGRIRERIGRELPFMATEELIVKAVRAGGDRQRVHEIIRKHSVAAARTMSESGGDNDLFDRLASDQELGVSASELREVSDAQRFIGRAPQQVDEFLAEVVEPLLAGAPSSERLPELRV